MDRVFSPFSVTQMLMLFFWRSWGKLQRHSWKVLGTLRKWLHKHTRVRQNTTSFGLRGLPCQLPTRMQFAFGPQHSRATSIGFNVSNGSNIYKPRGGSITEESERSTPLKYIIISDIPFSSMGGAKAIFIRDTKKFINRATWHSELEDSRVILCVDRLPLH